MNEKKIFVTRPAMPPLDEYVDSLKEIWDSKILTNNGPFHHEFEQALAEYLGVKYISLFANGTLALITALQALRIKGEVITTPYSFVATTHALWWNNIKPVFVDIKPDDFTINPQKIEVAITQETTAILPVHVYGNPCKNEQLQSIADTYGLKLIYDAAHAFGVKLKGKSIMKFGDLSVISFHATKVFSTIEGGAIVCNDKKTKERIDFLKNFGFVNETTVVLPGINAKMNELQAAYGLLQLRYIDEYVEKRKIVAELYRKLLNSVAGISFMNDIDKVRHTYSYFPVFIKSLEYGKTRDELYEYLKKNNVYARRYFYPLISQYPIYSEHPSAKNSNLPVSEKVAEQVLCLPIYPDLSLKFVKMIVKMIKDFAEMSR